MEKKNLIKQLILLMIAVMLLLVFLYGCFFIWKINKFENKLDQNSENISFFETIKGLNPQSEINLSGMENKRINILLLGIAGNGNSGKNLTDTIMIASIDTENNKAALLSIPRDLYVEIPDENVKTKINSVYEYGLRKYPQNEKRVIEPIKKTIEQITSLEINYWVILNFEGFIKAVDAIGGINIDNPRDIYDSRYPGPNYSYETFELKKGFHHLDGTTALKYARMRHNDPEGDFGRAKRQQQVMQSMKNKIFSAKTLLNVVALGDFFEALGDNIKINASQGEFGDFLRLIKKIDTENINNIVIDAWKKTSLLKVSHVFYGEKRAFILVPRVGSWSEIEEVSKNIFNFNELERRRKEISKENVRLGIINKSGNDLVAKKINELLRESFEYKNVFIFHDSNKNLENESLIYDLTDKDKPYTLDELIKKLPAKISNNYNDNYKKITSKEDLDLIVIIGKDLIENYTMAEFSIKDYNEFMGINEYFEINNK